MGPAPHNESCSDTQPGRLMRNRIRWRQLLRMSAESALTIRPIRSALERRSRGRSVVVAYHNIIPNDELMTGDPGAHLRLSDFQQHLDLLSRHFQVVPLEEVFTPQAVDGPLRIAITFDDAYRGTILLGLPELVKRQLPATVFIPTGLLGKGPFWWDEFEFSGWEGERIPLRQLRGHYPAVRAWALASGWKPRPQGPFQIPASEAEFLAAASSAVGIRFGTHTVSHRNLSELSEQEVRDELETSLEWFSKRGISPSPWLSYPYGLTGPHVEAGAKECGLEGALTITGGPVRPPVDNRFRAPRVNVPAGVSQQGLMLRIFGLPR